MTLLVGAFTRDAVWMMADRRLSWITGQREEYATKLMSIQTPDGSGLIGYAGLGVTALGCEPSEWLARTVRGYNLPMEKTLGLIASAAMRRVVSHTSDLETDHHFICTCFINKHPRLYTISLIRDSEQQHQLQFHRHARMHDVTKYTSPQMAIAGDGARYITNEDKTLARSVFKAYDRGQLNERAVTYFLGKLNTMVFNRMGKEKSVGPRCIVAWKKGDHTGNYEYICDGARDRDDPCRGIPTVMNGYHASAIAATIMSLMKNKIGQIFNDIDAGKPVNLFDNEIIYSVAKLPAGPDDSLP